MRGQPDPEMDKARAEFMAHELDRPMPKLYECFGRMIEISPGGQPLPVKPLSSLESHMSLHEIAEKHGGTVGEMKDGKYLDTTYPKPEDEQ